MGPMRRVALLVFVFGCGGVTAIPADAGPSKDTGTTDDASMDDDAGEPCPPPNLAPHNCVMCNAHVYCGM